MITAPRPKKISAHAGGQARSFPLRLRIPSELNIGAAVLNTVCPGAFTESNGESDVIFERRAGRAQSYCIAESNGKVSVRFSDEPGAFYALVSLWQLSKNGGVPEGLMIEDAPDIETRGFMLDISRGRVPKPETLERLIDTLARFKYNQLQLYIEGFSFFYPSFSEHCVEDSSLSTDDFHRLSDYCAARFIELVPNQNCLGHMSSWLSKPEFAHLAECEGGFSYSGFKLPATTLDAANPQSLKLAERMMDDLLPAFGGNKFHVGLDEPFELGRGKNAGCDAQALFNGYVSGLARAVSARGRDMLMWADAFQRFDCEGDSLPQGVTLLEWGYEKEHPFDKRCGKLEKAGAEFYVCPGTSSWLSFTGMTENMLQNIDSAVDAAAKYGAKGVLLTDWGDGGHMQPLPVSFAAIVYCAASSWNTTVSLSKSQLADALSLLAFEDRSNAMGQAALDAGSYYLCEEVLFPCRTLAHLFYTGRVKNAQDYAENLAVTAMLVNAMAPEEVARAYDLSRPLMISERADAVLSLIDRAEAQLSRADMSRPDGDLITEEYKAALDSVRFFTLVRKYIAEKRPTAALSELARELSNRCARAWRRANKESALEAGLQPIADFLSLEEK